MHQIKALWQYKYFILSSVKTEFKTRFARSKLGIVWMIIHPLSMVLVYALILSQIMTAKLPEVETQYAYPIYILSGVIAWTLFSEVLNLCLSVFVDNANLLKKLSFPKLALPAIVISTALVNFVLLMLIMFIVFGFLGHLPYGALQWLPVLVILTLLLATSIGLFFGILNVFIRDIGQFFTVLLQFWFWLTPIVYTISIVPQRYHDLFMLNPMTGIIMGFHNILLYNKAPDLSLLIYPFIIALFFITLIIIIYNKATEDMGDIL